MDKYTVIKNGLVMTLDRKGSAGFFNIIIKNDKIFLIDYDRTFNEKEFRLNYPEAEIINARNKLIIPGFFNSKSVSSYTLNKIFFKKCSYQNINSWLSLKLVENYLSSTDNFGLFSDLLKITYSQSLSNGEIFVNECSPTINKEFTDSHYDVFSKLHQHFNITIYDQKSKPDTEKKISTGFFTDEDTNNYSLTSLKKLLYSTKSKLIVEASFSEKAYESINEVFGKNLIPVLADMDLISSNTIISNPTHLNQFETEILKSKNASVLICPSDYINLSYKKTDIARLLQSGVNVLTGTGYTGISILSELKKLSVMASGNNISFENIFKTAIGNPSMVFGMSNLTGVIEKNRYADMIMFDLKDYRNILTIPEADPDFICELILDKLCEKDISDVMIKGEYLIKDHNKKFSYIENINSVAIDIVEKIYSAGKYFEFRDRTIARGRVDRIDNVYRENEVIKNEIFVDMTETGQYEGEGEFSIIGTKEEEIDKPREKTKPDKSVNINVKELKSMDSGINFLDDIADLQDIPAPKIKGRKLTGAELSEEKKEMESEIKEIFTEHTDSENEQKNIKQIETADTEAQKAEDEKSTTPPVIKKTKLKFGFKEGE